MVKLNKKYMQIIKQHIKYLLLGLLPVFAFSCSDFLEQEPGSSVSVDEQFSTYEGFEEALNGAYYNLENLYSNEAFAVYADVMGGNISFSPSSTSSTLGEVAVSSYVKKIYPFEDDADESDMETVYKELYSNINEVNQILAYLPTLTDISEDSINQIKSESLCIRAFDHFVLVNIYAQNYTYTDDASHKGIIYNQSVQEVGVDYPARETIATTYTYIIKDLETALDNFTSTNVLEGESYSYFTTNACKALLAKVMLFAGDYEKAISYAGEVILNSGIQLMSKDEYVEEWSQTDVPVSEIIMELSASQNNEGDYVGTLSEFYNYTSESDYEDYTASADLLSLYETDDVRGYNMFIEATLSTQVSYQESLVDENYYFTRKFQDNPGVPLLRLSEMYLIRAEAYVRVDEPENALTDLNTLRENRGATTVVATDDLLEEIFTERRKELCFEGNLLFDIARFHKDIERNAGCIANTCDLSYPSSYYILPIPQYTIDLNSNLVQNEDY